jgi:amino-acid N-acetyltransferase
MEIRRAIREEVAAVDDLLRENDLPGLPPALPLSNLLVAKAEGELVGAVALEVAGRCGLLRCAVVAVSHRGNGIGGELVSSLVSRAHELGLRDLYLLTENAEAFFAAQDFVRIARDDLPPEIRATREFRELCPESAVAMRFPLATRF